jgi:hypothetical protein
MARGTIKHVWLGLYYGIIRSDVRADGDPFFHLSEIRFADPQPGDRVQFDHVDGFPYRADRTRAVNIIRIPEEPTNPLQVSERKAPCLTSVSAPERRKLLRWRRSPDPSRQVAKAVRSRRRLHPSRVLVLPTMPAMQPARLAASVDLNWDRPESRC